MEKSQYNNIITIITFCLALMNLLPLPILDGGHILISLIEIVIRKHLPSKLMQPICMFFAILLIVLMLFATFNDVNRLVDFKKLFSELCCKRLQFASSVLLEEKLNLKAGSVSLFGPLNDENNEVELVIDDDVYNADIVSFHPNINTATIELEKDMFYQVLGLLKKIIKS